MAAGRFQIALPPSMYTAARVRALNVRTAPRSSRVRSERWAALRQSIAASASGSRMTAARCRPRPEAMREM